MIGGLDLLKMAITGSIVAAMRHSSPTDGNEWEPLKGKYMTYDKLGEILGNPSPFMSPGENPTIRNQADYDNYKDNIICDKTTGKCTIKDLKITGTLSDSIVVSKDINILEFKNVDFPDNEIHTGTFTIPEVTEFVIPDSIVTICSSIFDSPEKLATLTIGKGVTSIADDAFDNCSKLTVVKLTGNTIKKTVGERKWLANTDDVPYVESNEIATYNVTKMVKVVICN